MKLRVTKVSPTVDGQSVQRSVEAVASQAAAVAAAEAAAAAAAATVSGKRRGSRSPRRKIKEDGGEKSDGSCSRDPSVRSTMQPNFKKSAHYAAIATDLETELAKTSGAENVATDA